MCLLFEKGKIGSLFLKNKIIMTAVHTGFSLEEETRFLERRAKGGAAAVTAVMGVSGTGASGNMCVLEETIIEPLRKMSKTIHRESGKLIVQLFHAGRNGCVAMLADPTAVPVAPSSIPSPIYRTIPLELTEEGIQNIIKEFGVAAGVCKAACVDAVEISCSAGYLLSQFISPLTNKREDGYGGSLKNRLRFPIEVVKEVRKVVGSFYPVILRVSASDMLGGYGLEETIALIRSVEREIDAVNVTGGWHESEVPQISMHLPEGGFAFLARAVKQQVDIPVIACNRINNEETARQILEEGCADFVGCARAFIIDSDFVNKMKNGTPYRRCIGCNKGCIERILKHQKICCIFNPEVGRETWEKSCPDSARRVLVVGGGPAGMESALQYAKKGHEVRLCTNENMVGGLLHVAAKAPYKKTIAGNIKAMRSELEYFKVQVCCSTEVNGGYVESYNPDLVIVATGSRPMIPLIPGIDQPHVYTAQQVLKGGDKLIAELLKGKVLIVGGGSVGLETALYLSGKSDLYAKSRKFLSHRVKPEIKELLRSPSNITIVDIAEKMGGNLGGLRRFMLKELEEYNINLIASTRVEDIREGTVTISINGKENILETDYVILAAGYQPQGKVLIDWLTSNRQYPYQVIGDAQRIGGIGKALNDAYELVNV
jgi:2,4-dienoyl-CoA reductase (NADPH2)